MIITNKIESYEKIIELGLNRFPEKIFKANELAKINGLTSKMENVCAPCEEVLPDIIANERNDTRWCDEHRGSCVFWLRRLS